MMMMMGVNIPEYDDESIEHVEAVADVSKRSVGNKLQ